MLVIGEVSNEAFEPDCDIESRPRKQVAGARVGMRAHEHDDRQLCRLTAEDATVSRNRVLEKQ